MVFEDYNYLQHLREYKNDNISDIATAIYKDIQEFYDASNSEMSEIGYSKVELYESLQLLCAEVMDKKYKSRPIISKIYSFFSNEPSTNKSIPVSRAIHMYITVVPDEYDELALAPKTIMIDPLPKID